VRVSTLVRDSWPLETRTNTISDVYENPARIHIPGFASIATDTSDGPFRGRLYVLWTDARNGKDEMYLAFSDDIGRTWSPGRVVSDEQPRLLDGGDALHGMVAVNAAGVVGVMWFDRMGRPANNGYSVRFRASLDGGEAFTPSVVVSEKDYDPQLTDPIPLYARFVPGGPKGQLDLKYHQFNRTGGHTAGFAADAGGDFHALWIGNVTKLPQLWTARIHVEGTVQKNGAGELAKLVDATSDIVLRITDRWLHRANGNLEATVALENTSADTIRGPIKLRVLELISDLGTVKILNADGGGEFEGAVWDFTPQLAGGLLAPKSRSGEKTLRLQFTPADGTTCEEECGVNPNIVGIRFKVLARALK
ncbi:MAG TPA: hypothetical protein VIW67_10555, partial [Terriglobales bacterium]